MRRFFFTFLALVPASLAIATVSQQIRPAMAEEPAGAQATFDKMCKSCHAADGKGNAAKAKVLKIDATKLDLTRDEAVKMSREDKKKIVMEGKEKMPSYAKKLDATQVDALLDIVEGLQKAGK